MSSVIISGTFAIGWTAALVDALETNGVHAVGDVPYTDLPTQPFALLMHRAKAVRAGAGVLCACMHDTLPKHPQISRLLDDLAGLVMPSPANRVKIMINAPENEFFATCVASGLSGTYHELVNPATDRYIDGNVTKIVYTPAHIADTPHVLREHLAGL